MRTETGHTKLPVRILGEKAAIDDSNIVRRFKKWHIGVPDFKVQVFGFGDGFPEILTDPSGSAKVAV